MNRAIMSFVCIAVPALACAGAPDPGSWQFLGRIAMSGEADESDPAGINVYSGFGLEAALRRGLGHDLALEASVRTESREVDRETGGDVNDPLGSLEVLPLTLTLQYHLDTDGRWRPYVGAGAVLTVVWEKSGFLDTYDVTPRVDPGVQLGVDWAAGRTIVLNLDIRWNPYTADIHDGDVDLADVTVDPMTLSVGVGFGL